MFGLISCGGADSILPEGWEDAARLADFSQSACMDDGDSASDEEPVEVIHVRAQPGVAIVHWADVTFRCDQPLEAYVRRGQRVDVLVQPIDLLPEGAARCDCRYELDFAINIDEGDRSFGFYVRRDELAGPSSPSLVGTVTVP
ncbi:MAG: hypothetical protein EA397_16150 [Deltaproteobacteria bacterium]|nr:MAG: hypothetical protein EA397_16150 [Deltaproteobacteria bacterium]